jgi:hypothetical protein
MVSEKPKFSCDSCGKTYEWKLALAGRRAKCKCGATIMVPTELPGAAEPDGLYDFAEPSPLPAAGAVPAAIGNAAPAIAYATPDPVDKRFSFDNLYHKPRDFYFPTAAFVIGFIALLVWAAYVSGGSSGAVLLFSGFLCVTTLFKTVVMIGAAFVIAPMAGVSFGGIWTAVLKLAAIAVVTDAGLFWLQTIMEATGAYPTTGGYARRAFVWIAVINTMLAAALIGIMLRLFFDMDRDEVATIAVPLAILNRILNFLILLALAFIIDRATATLTAPAPVAAPPTGTLPGGGGAPGATTPAAPPVPAVSQEVLERDREISRMIQQGIVAREAREHYQTSLAKSANKQQVLAIYDAGPKRLYIAGRRLIVEMPADAAARKRVIDALTALRQHLGVDADLTDHHGRFIEMPLPKP